MIIRRYTGTSMDRLRAAVERDLGRNAVIVATETRQKKALLPGMAGTLYEVTAVAEDSRDAELTPAAPAVPAVPAAPGEPGLSETLLEVQNRQYRGLRQAIRLLDEKLADVDVWMETLSTHVGGDRGTPELARVHPARRAEVARAANRLAGGEGPGKEHWIQAVATVVAAAPGLAFEPAGGAGPMVYAVTGPTGVGKTTTLAKLAAKCVLGRRLTVGMMTVDTFRIAGVEQLREYASLLGVEFAVAFSDHEVDASFERFRDKDVVLIDTPGRSQFDSVGIREIRRKLGDLGRLRAVLTVTANVRREEVESIVRGYAMMAPSAVIITKADEASCCDGLTQLLDTCRVPAVYITDGQRVPEDIHEATPELIAALVVGGGETTADAQVERRCQDE